MARFHETRPSRLIILVAAIVVILRLSLGPDMGVYTSAMAAAWTTTNWTSMLSNSTQLGPVAPEPTNSSTTTTTTTTTTAAAAGTNGTTTTTTTVVTTTTTTTTAAAAAADNSNPDNVTATDCSVLQFAVTGFAKSGTSSLMQLFLKHPQIAMPRHELDTLHIDPEGAMEEMKGKANWAKRNRPGHNVNGYKNPFCIQWQGSLDFYRTRCPATKHLVSVRHPVLWFESFYNFRMRTARNARRWVTGRPNSLIGGEEENPDMMFSASGAFHRYLARLRKTALLPEEMELIGKWQAKDDFPPSLPYFPNPILLLELSQFSDSNATRQQILLDDIGVYVNVTRPLQAIPRNNVHSDHKPKNTDMEMDICAEEYQPIHDEMMLIARNASIWIRDYFLQSPDVQVSSPDYFRELLGKWLIDPCIARREKQLAS